VGTLSLALRAAGSVEAAAPRRITMSDLGPAFEIYADAQDGEGEETAVDLLAKNMEETFQAIETRINQMGQEFTRNPAHRHRGHALRPQRPGRRHPRHGARGIRCAQAQCRRGRRGAEVESSANVAANRLGPMHGRRSSN
jgi:hypothetical protein